MELEHCRAFRDDWDGLDSLFTRTPISRSVSRPLRGWLIEEVGEQRVSEQTMRESHRTTTVAGSDEEWIEGPTRRVVWSDETGECTECGSSFEPPGHYDEPLEMFPGFEPVPGILAA